MNEGLEALARMIDVITDDYKGKKIDELLNDYELLKQEFQADKRKISRLTNLIKKYQQVDFLRYRDQIEKLELRIKELEESDVSKEQSSISYYNEMRKYKTKLKNINVIVKNIKTLSGDNYDYEQINKIIEVLDK